MLLRPYRRGGKELPTTVSKYDVGEEIEHEAAKTRTNGLASHSRNAPAPAEQWADSG